MENKNKKISNGNAMPSVGSSVPKAKPQGKGPAIKEGDPNQQRPVHGGDGGNNTSPREDQLPLASDGNAQGSRTHG